MNNQANQRRAAIFISFITNPALVVSATVVVVIRAFADSQTEFWRGSAIGLGLLILPALLYSAFIWRKEGYVDIDISERRDRIVPLMLASLGAIIGAYLVQTKLSNQTFAEMSFILVTLLMTLTLVTTIWKISLHAATLSALSSLLVLYRGEVFALGYLFLPLIFWSRLSLKQHTKWQLIAGTLVGAGLTFASAWFFRTTN